MQKTRIEKGRDETRPFFILQSRRYLIELF